MSPERKVLEVLGRSAGGMARHVADVVSELDGRPGLSVEVAGPRDLPIAMPNLRHPLTIPDRAVRGHMEAARNLRKIIDAGSYDVVHAHGLRAGADAVLASRAQAHELVVTLHNLALPGASFLRSHLQARAERLVLAGAMRVLAPSVQIGTHLKKLSPQHADKVEVLHVAIRNIPPIVRSSMEVIEELGVPDGRHLIVTTARLAPQKDLPTLIRGVSKVPHAFLAILGDGPLRPALATLIADLGLQQRVKLLGFRENVYDYVRAADVFCLSSTWEAVSLAAQEAAAVGTPIVATDVGGIGELVEDGISGRLVPPGDPDALALAISDVLASPEKARSFAERADERLRERFGRSRMFDRLAEIYLGSVHA